MSTETQEKVKVKFRDGTVRLTPSQAENVKKYLFHIQEALRLWWEELRPYHFDPEDPDGSNTIDNPEPLPRALLHRLEAPEDFIWWDREKGLPLVEFLD